MDKEFSRKDQLMRIVDQMSDGQAAWVLRGLEQEALVGGQKSTQAEPAATGTLKMEQEPRGIGWAVKQMHNGLAVTRRGWNGKGMFLRIQFPDSRSMMTRPYVYMLTADQQRVPWLCSQSDLLAYDWDTFLTQ